MIRQTPLGELCGGLVSRLGPLCRHLTCLFSPILCLSLVHLLPSKGGSWREALRHVQTAGRDLGTRSLAVPGRLSRITQASYSTALAGASVLSHHPTQGCEVVPRLVEVIKVDDVDLASCLSRDIGL